MGIRQGTEKKDAIKHFFPQHEKKQTDWKIYNRIDSNLTVDSTISLSLVYLYIYRLDFPTCKCGIRGYLNGCVA